MCARSGDYPRTHAPARKIASDCDNRSMIAVSEQRNDDEADISGSTTSWPAMTYTSVYTGTTRSANQSYERVTSGPKRSAKVHEFRGCRIAICLYCLYACKDIHAVVLITISRKIAAKAYDDQFWRRHLKSNTHFSYLLRTCMYATHHSRN